MNWWRNLKGRVSLAEPLKNHTTFKVGGPAKFFIEPKDPDDLRLLLKSAKRYDFPVFIIGRGSNVLVSEKGVRGAVISLSAPYFKRLSFYGGNYLKAGSGILLSKVVSSCAENGLSGAEFLSGIPGTVGGALAMNAGVGGRGSGVKSIGDLVEEVTVMDYHGSIKALRKKDIKFGYRESSLSKYIILGADLKLAKAGKGKINEKVKEYIYYRRLTQDLSGPSCGCIFKNPAGDSAGRLIDLCGLKGKKVRDAFVSEKHANFILNAGHAQTQDILKLMDFIKKEVKDRFNIALEPEIKIWKN